MVNINTKRIINLLPILLLAIFTVSLIQPSEVHAADANFTDGITVDSTLDTPDDTIDGVCDDGDGNCTLRAAIEEANAHAGADVINFNITGTPDFGSDGYRIEPATGLPGITEALTIDGTTQPEYVANTAANPQPLNGHIVIEIDGNQTTNATSLAFENGSDNSVVRGISIGGFKWGITFNGSQNAVVEGNYLGIRADGSAFGGAPDSGVSFNGGSNNSRLGGTSPSQRNAIGNISVAGVFISDFETDSTTVTTSNVVVQGNFFGLRPDGITAAPIGGHAISIIGSSQNQIGGTSLAARNIIGNSADGITVMSSPDHNANGNIIQGNYVGVLADGITPAGLSSNGIGVRSLNVGREAKGNIIGGTAAGAGNLVANVQFGYIGLDNSSQTVVQGNYLGADSSGELNGSNPILAILISGSENLIGGTAAGAGNIIANGTYGGVVVSSSSLITAQHAAILGNSIHDNSAGGPATMGGIELNASSSSGFSPDINVGPTPNDVGDSDTGSNNYINTPVINSAQYNGSTLVVNYDLDAADSPTDEYRIEFFGNTAPSPIGYGEGETYLGSAVVSPGTGNKAALTVPSGYDLDGKYITATTTAVDGTKASGFGSTSEFSLAVTTSFVDNLDDGSTSNGNSNSDPDSTNNDSKTLSSTGENVNQLLALVALLLTASGIGLYIRRRTKQQYFYKG